MRSTPAKADLEGIRKDFPILKILMNGRPLVYLDSAATSQKPNQVIDAEADFYRSYNANIHRGIYQISEMATEKYIESKSLAAKFINAGGIDEIVYTKNTTESINLVALTWADQNVKKGDHILISQMEHHSNLVPWQVLAAKKKAVLDYIKLDNERSRLDKGSLEAELGKNPKIVAITHASNVLGTINDVKSITKAAHRSGAKVLVDGAQSTPHMKADVKEIDCDFFAFSAHKMLGPMGLGVLYAKRELLEATEPLFTGGDMIRSVTYGGHSWNDLPWKFESGTSNAAGGIAFGAAINYLNKIGMDRVREHEKRLTKYALEELEKVNGVRVFGLSSKDIGEKAGVISFSVDKVHPHDVSQIFDNEGIAIRAGHHCAMPLVVETLGESALSRMSFYLYNDENEVDKAVAAIGKVKSIFKV